jgi:soluble lytic murein transglycosylase
MRYFFITRLILAIAAGYGFGALAASAHGIDNTKLSESDIAAYRAAFASAQAGNWRLASEQAATAQHKLPNKVLSWLRYKTPRSGARFEDIAAFITSNTGWPGLWSLRRRAEEAMRDTRPNRDVLAWFQRYPALTAPGSTRYAQALIATGQRQRATKFLRAAWIGLNMSAREGRAFRREFRKYLRAGDHAARLDRLIWDQRVGAARRQMQRVGRDRRNLAQARLMLMRRTGGVDGAIARVPESMRGDTGLIYERLRWRRRKGFTDSAIELLRNSPERLQRPRKWWYERAILARRALRGGDITRAYRLARDHRQTTGTAFAEAEWLAGWIALRFLDEADIALGHFTRLYNKARYPISRARGAYWAGRAAETSDNAMPDPARNWYRLAARHLTTFYGQLAQNRLLGVIEPQPEPVPDQSQRIAFEKRERVRLVRMLSALKLRNLVKIFIGSLMRDTGHRENWILVARLADELGRSDLSVLTAKRAVRDGVFLSKAGYPALPNSFAAGPDSALIHALIRQESAFDAEAISRSGARGLMQLMPATAKRVAQQLKIRYSRQRLTADPKHNIDLGSAYLAQLMRRYDGSIVLALAAYNAGPARVNRWLRANGDPRTTSVRDAIDWVEAIPFAETRNYVQRVLENVPIYGYRLQGRFVPARVADALTGSDRTDIP